MHTKLSFIVLITILMLLSCSVGINPTRCDIKVKQGNLNIPNNSGFVDYGNIPLGYFQSITFNIENTGTEKLQLLKNPPVLLYGENKYDFILLAGNTAQSIAPDSSTTFQLIFQPTSLGVKTAKIEIVSNDSNDNPFTFVITGTCTQPAPEIHIKQDANDILNSSGSYEYGFVNVYSSSNPITFTIENNGNKDLKLTGNPDKIILDGTDSSMFQVIESQTQSIIPSLNSTSFEIMFVPTSPGIKTAKVIILNNDSDENPYTFKLYGTGVAVPEINVKQGNTDIENGNWNYDFENVVIGESSSDIQFTIENIGSSAVRLSDAPDCVKIFGTDKASFSVNQSSTKEILQPGESTTFSLKFSPGSFGDKVATVSIANNDVDENPFTFTIKGNGVESEINVKAGSQSIPNNTGVYDFGDVGVNGSNSYVIITIESLGDGKLRLTGSPKIQISGINASLFTIEQANTASSLEKGQSTSFGITFTPLTVGTKSATISISNNDTDENPYTFSITGTGCNYNSGEAIGWIGGGSDGWKMSTAPAQNTDYQSFKNPNGICVDNVGNIYVADYQNNRICKWTSSGVAIGWIGGGSDGWKTGSAPSTPGNDMKSFYHPSDVHVDGSGNIFVADYENDRICKWDKDGNAIGWIGGGNNGWQKTSGATISTSYNGFFYPIGLFVDSSGYIYVADQRPNRICKWDSNGIAIGWIGHGSSGWQTTNASYSYTRSYNGFNSPNDVFVDSSGNIYVADRNNFRVCKWNSSGNAIGWIGFGSNGWKTTTSPYSFRNDYQSFNNPKCVYVDSNGDLYITDSGNNRVCKWDASGNALGWIGGGSDGWKISSGASRGFDYQSFYRPTSVYMKNGMLYISDEINHRISKWYK